MLTNVLTRWSRTLSGVAASLLAVSVLLSGCQGVDNENPTTVSAGSTIPQLAGNSTQLTFLTAAVNRAGLGATLSGAGPFTVFAPTDAAFQAAGFANVAAINGADPTALSNILLYHVVSGTAVQSAAIPVAQSAFPSSLSANPVYVTKTSSGSVSVNGARVITADQTATNGVVHIIDQVLLPPTGNILQVAQGDTSLALLTAAALRGGAVVTAALGGTTPLTVFAPTNAAFRLTPFNSVAAITAADPTALAAVLTNHVVANARVYSPTLTNAQTITTFGGGSLTATVGSNNAISILSKGNGTNAANILTGPRNRDITVTNGVIHKIDRVLLP